MPMPGKYRAKPQTVNGIKFPSMKEAQRWAQLQIMERGKTIHNLKRQPRFAIIVNCQMIGEYRGDFQYVEGGHTVVEDTKGYETPEFKLKWAAVNALYPEIQWRKL